MARIRLPAKARSACLDRAWIHAHVPHRLWLLVRDALGIVGIEHSYDYRPDSERALNRPPSPPARADRHRDAQATLGRDLGSRARTVTAGRSSETSTPTTVALPPGTRTLSRAWGSHASGREPERLAEHRSRLKAGTSRLLTPTALQPVPGHENNLSQHATPPPGFIAGHSLIRCLARESGSPRMAVEPR